MKRETRSKLILTPKLREAHTSKKRFLEIDLIRGVAICLVVLYHFIFDLSYFRFFQIELYNGFWLYFQRLAAVLFVLIFGICISISANKTDYEKKAVKRFLQLAAIALLITIATWIYPREGFIVFGVMHFLATATLLSVFFVKKPHLNVLFGILLIITGLYVNTQVALDYWLIPFGIPTANFYSLDYFPLLPWFGVVLIGMTLGRYVYVQNKIRIEIPQNKFTEKVSFLGRNTLVIYLLHQPVLIALIQMATFLF